MLYLIGLGLDVKGISKQGLAIAKKCKKIYLENYTVEFPYSEGELKEVIGKKIISADREFVESLKIIDESRKIDTALLIYGSPLTATTHISLIQEAKRCGVKYRVIHNASILDAVAETGLQLYKFGKTASMPEFEADSFMEIVKDNKKINAHSLILIDMGIESDKALEKLESAAKKHKIEISKIVVCSQLGTDKRKIFYDNLDNLKNKNIKSPYCIIIPSKLHFLEKEVLEGFES